MKAVYPAANGRGKSAISPSLVEFNDEDGKTVNPLYWMPVGI